MRSRKRDVSRSVSERGVRAHAGPVEPDDSEVVDPMQHKAKLSKYPHLRYRESANAIKVDAPPADQRREVPSATDDRREASTECAVGLAPASAAAWGARQVRETGAASRDGAAPRFHPAVPAP